MRNLEKQLTNRRIQKEQLLKYGFQQEKDSYIYKTKIQKNQFEVKVVISDKKSYAQLTDLENETEFALVDIESSTGLFVGKLKQDYNKIIDDIIRKCTSKEIFKSKQAKEIIKYIKQRYEDHLEFLWEKYDNNAIWRNQQNRKWYGVLLILAEEKLGIKSDKIVEVIDLRYQKEKVSSMLEKENIFPGYHMNKKSWITIKLDESLSTKELFKLIDNSYQLSIGNKCGMTGDNLSQKVYEYLMTIPKGKVVTYKQIAESLGNKGLARVVGNILHKNPDEHKYPCYKVLNSRGELAEAFVFGGKEVQKEKLQKDGIKVINNKVDLAKYQWRKEQ